MSRYVVRQLNKWNNLISIQCIHKTRRSNISSISHINKTYHHYQQKRHFVQAILKPMNPDNSELNDLEEQAYGCTENAQYTRALLGFQTLIEKDPSCARYYFDYGLTIIRYIDLPSQEMLNDSYLHFRQAVSLSPNESRIIKTFGSLLTNSVFFSDKIESINEARLLFEGYYNRMILNNDLNDSDIYSLIDCDVLYLYAQLLDDHCKDYIESREIFEKCIYIASKQNVDSSQIDEYRLRYGFYLYKQQNFDLAIEQFNLILLNINKLDEFNRDPNAGLDKKDQTNMNNYLIRKYPSTLSHIFANMYLGVIHSDLDQMNRAKYYYEKMMFYKDKFYVKDNNLMQIIMLNEYILYLIKIGSFDIAHEHWMEAYRIDKLLSVNSHSRLQDNYLGTSNIDVLVIGGHLFSEKGFKKKSQKYWKNIIKMVSTISDNHLDKYGYQNPYYFYGLHCLKNNQFKLAKDSFMKVCKLHPEFPEFLYRLSESCAKLKEYDESKKYLIQAMNMNFNMIYPKYFTNSDTIFKHIYIDIPDEKKREMLAK